VVECPQFWIIHTHQETPSRTTHKTELPVKFPDTNAREASLNSRQKGKKKKGKEQIAVNKF